MGTSLQTIFHSPATDSAKAQRSVSFLLRIARSQTFWFGVASFIGVCIYVVIQVAYIERVPLIMDEFDGAYDVFRLREQIPYRDHTPYKTVLGYYIQLIPLLAGQSVWQGLINVKITMALINASCILVSVVLLARIWSRAAIVLALPLWLSMSDWLERSSDLRVDTMTGLAGLFSLLALLRARPLLAGAFAGVSFLISQKAVYFGISAAVGLMALSLFAGSWRANVRELSRFTLGGFFVLLPYLFVSALLSSANRAFHSTFISHRSIAFTDIYPHLRRYWFLSIERNPGFYACVLIGLFVLLTGAFIRRYSRFNHPDAMSNRERSDRVLCGYAFALFALGLWHKQPWPYFFVLLIPTGFVVIVAAFDVVLRWSAMRRTVAASACSFGLLAVIVLSSLVPQSARATIRLKEDSRYQASTISLASKLVSQGQYYFAGVDLLYDRTQSSTILQRYSFTKRKRLRKIDNAEVDRALKELKLYPPIILVNNYRFRHLPRRVKKYLKARYQPYWGSVDIYSPAFWPGEQTLYLDFSGRYEVSIEGGGSARIRGRRIYHGDHLLLSEGSIRIRSARAGRLKLKIDGVESLLDTRFGEREPLFGEHIYER